MFKVIDRQLTPRKRVFGECVAECDFYYYFFFKGGKRMKKMMNKVKMWLSGNKPENPTQTER